MGLGSLHHDARVKMTDPIEGWGSEFASGLTIPGFQEWIKRQPLMAVRAEMRSERSTKLSLRKAKLSGQQGVLSERKGPLYDFVRLPGTVEKWRVQIDG